MTTPFGPGRQDEEPVVSPLEVERLRKLTWAEVSIASRVGYSLLLLVSLAAAGLGAALWITEPDLPARTQTWFAAAIGVALFWTAVAGRALMTRRVLFARHKVLVAWLAVGCSALMTAGAVVAAATGAIGEAAYPAVLVATLMWGGSVGLLVAAKRRMTRLLARRVTLERELARGVHDGEVRS